MDRINNLNALYLGFHLLQCMRVFTTPAPECVWSFPHPRYFRVSIPCSATSEPLQLVSVSAPSGLADLTYLYIYMYKGCRHFQMLKEFLLSLFVSIFFC